MRPSVALIVRLALFAFGIALGAGALTAWQRYRPDVPVAAAHDDDEFAASPSPAGSARGGGERIVGIGYVDVESGVTPLAFSAPGSVARIVVTEGQAVRQGQPLIQLENTRAASQATKAEAAVVEAQSRLERAREAERAHGLSIRQQEQAVVAARIQKNLVERQVEALRDLADSAAASEEKLRTALDQQESLSASFRVEELRLEQLRLTDPHQNVVLAEAAVKAAKADADAAKRLLADHTLSAPSAGRVLRILAAAGQVTGVNPLQPAIWFCADEPLLIRAEVDQAYAPRMHEGLVAEVCDDDRRNVLARGRIVRLAPWIAQRRALLDEPFQRNDVRTLECLVALAETPTNLRIGQRVRVVFDLKRPDAESTPALDVARRP